MDGWMDEQREGMNGWRDGGGTMEKKRRKKDNPHGIEHEGEKIRKGRRK